jgi:uncharacterized Fe-S cluster protein YjdI
MEKNYSNGEITVNWKPELCIHSTKCWKSLPRVFNPRAKPWVNMEGATTEAIRQTVLACPSGALSLKEEEVVVEKPVATSETEVCPLPNGPLQLTGRLRIVNEAGEEVIKTDKTFFCRCGSSANKPYCDGSHRKIGFQG